jgi:hypothetical protein
MTTLSKTETAPVSISQQKSCPNERLIDVWASNAQEHAELTAGRVDDKIELRSVERLRLKRPLLALGRQALERETFNCPIDCQPLCQAMDRLNNIGEQILSYARQHELVHVIELPEAISE